MSELIINNHIIDAPLNKILTTLKSELTNGKLMKIENKGSEFRVTCPNNSHKGGQEKTPSCNICATSSGDIEFGYCHCFTCGFAGHLYHFVAECFDADDEFGKEWLLQRFGHTLVDERTGSVLENLDLDFVSKNNLLQKNETNYLNETYLDTLQSWHPYMSKRKLSREICEKFKVKYDSKSDCIVFPVYDENSKLYMMTKRSVIGKQFYIDKDIDKPIYLLYHILNNNITTVIVTESQINCLTCYVYGLPAIALFGTGTTHQYELLKKSGIRHYILCFDGDDAGRRGAKRFINEMPRDVFITDVEMPKGKDVNDLTKEEFFSILQNNDIDCAKLIEVCESQIRKKSSQC